VDVGEEEKAFPKTMKLRCQAGAKKVVLALSESEGGFSPTKLAGGS